MKSVSSSDITKAAREEKIRRGKVKSAHVLEVIGKYPKGTTTIIIKKETGLSHGAIDSIFKRNKKLLTITYKVDNKRKRLLRIIKLKTRKKYHE